jgi:anti-sigma factor RsiW
MTCEQCNEWLGDAVDGALDAERQAQIDAHCRACAACRELLSDLKDIRAAAATLERRTPSPKLWHAIAAQVDPATSKRRSREGGPQLIRLAAAAALVIMLGAAAWFVVGQQRRSTSDGGASDLVRNAASELQLAEQHYANAITALEQLTVARDNALDPSVAAEIAQSLRSIDRAIDDSRAALKSDPNSFVAQTSLLEALRMKVALLQETVSLMNARS